MVMFMGNPYLAKTHTNKPLIIIMMKVFKGDTDQVL